MAKQCTWFFSGLLAVCFSATVWAEERINVLIVDGQNNHAWQQTTPFMKKELEACGRFSVNVATSPAKPRQPSKPKDGDEAAKSKFEEEAVQYKKADAEYRKTMATFRPEFSKYQVVLLNYNGDSWPDNTQKDLVEYVASGKGGLVIIHAANNSFSSWKEYNLMIGMGWRGNSFGDRLITDDQGKELRVNKGQGPGAGHGAKHSFTITIRDRAHPIVKDMPVEWKHASDELYHGMRGPIENVHLIATAYSDKKSGGTGDNEPMIWTVSYGKGRVFHTPMGHDLESMRCVGFITTLLRGTEWAATGQVTLPIPKEFPSAERTSSTAK